MNELIKVEIETKDGMNFVSSRVIADQLGKRHADVVNQIDKISKDENVRRSFVLSSYVHNGNVYNEYLLSTDKEIKQFVEKVQNGNVSRKASKKMSKVTLPESLKIQTLIGKDVRGYRHRLHSNAVKHINQRHGVKGKADNSMADINDIARIDYEMRNTDNIDIVRNSKGKPDVTTAFLNSDNSPRTSYTI